MMGLIRVTMFWGAFLLFLLQPIVGRLLLPKLGGSPAVWITCQMFFQLALLAGYSFSHFLARSLSTIGQARLHLLVCIAGIAAPIAILEAGDADAILSPIRWLVRVLAICEGAPFFALAATSPLLQQWFSKSNHVRAANPYSLFVASNVGSLLSLAIYPLIVEPNLGLDRQIQLWRIGYGLFCVLMVACVIWLRKNCTTANVELAPENNSTTFLTNEISRRERFRWVAIAFVPSSWMLGVTTYITTDLAPVPLLWALPLALYLISFIVAFLDRPLLSLSLLRRLLPLAVLLLVASLLFRGYWQSVVIHLAAFAIAAWTLHAELAAIRPAAKNLTEFYLWLSVGGCLGGLFNGFVAPQIFPVMLEYPLAIAASMLLLPQTATLARGEPQKLDVLSLGIVVAIVAWMSRTSLVQGTTVSLVVLFLGFLTLIVTVLLRKPRWMAVVLAVVMVTEKWQPPFEGETLFVGRSFFGSHRVLRVSKINRTMLLHGNIVHGMQDQDSQDSNVQRQPLAYYHHQGPLGDVFDSQRSQGIREVAVIGLGTGAIAAYRQPQQRFTFFEIDPLVKQIAETSRYFTYLSDSGLANCPIEIGDGRQRMAAARDDQFDLIVLDAFSSDIIPVHLLTREAVQIYGKKLSESGLLVFHVSNSHIDLEPILGDVAAAENWVGVARHEYNLSQELLDAGRAPASYVVLARHPKNLANLERKGWWALQRSAGRAPWTDNYSNILQALKKY